MKQVEESKKLRKKIKDEQKVRDSIKKNHEDSVDRFNRAKDKHDKEKKK